MQLMHLPPIHAGPMPQLLHDVAVAVFSVGIVSADSSSRSSWLIGQNIHLIHSACKGMGNTLPGAVAGELKE